MFSGIGDNMDAVTRGARLSNSPLAKRCGAAAVGDVGGSRGDVNSVSFRPVSLPLILVFHAAFIYAAGALLVKRAAELGVGVWRTAFVANMLNAVLFQPLLLLGGEVHATLWWQPAIVAVMFFAGQWFSFVAFERGDVSVATPVMGIKILFVAAFVTALAGEALPWQIWAAAVFATAGIALLNRGSGRGAHHNIGRTIVMAGLAAACYALFDVFVQKWAPAWGAGRFLPLVMAVNGALSFAFIPLFRAPLRAIPGATWPWLLGGTLAFTLQALLFVTTIAKWGQAASANVVYSSRGLWSVLLVWLVGGWLRIPEQQLGSRALAWRLAGAVLMMSAIVLVLA